MNSFLVTFFLIFGALDSQGASLYYDDKLIGRALDFEVRENGDIIVKSGATKVPSNPGGGNIPTPQGVILGKVFDPYNPGSKHALTLKKGEILSRPLKAPMEEDWQLSVSAVGQSGYSTIGQKEMWLSETPGGPPLDRSVVGRGVEAFNISMATYKTRATFKIQPGKQYYVNMTITDNVSIPIGIYVILYTGRCPVEKRNSSGNCTAFK